MKVLFAFLIVEVFGLGIYIDFLFCLKVDRGVRGGLIVSEVSRFEERGLTDFGRSEDLRILRCRDVLV